MARARLTAMQAHHCSSEGALSSLEEAIGDKEKQMAQLREQRDRAEQDKQEERELHERELAEYKMKIHALESEVSGGRDFESRGYGIAKNPISSMEIYLHWRNAEVSREIFGRQAVDTAPRVCTERSKRHSLFGPDS